MITVMILIGIIFVLLHLVIFWIVITEDKEDYKKYYDRCNGCNSGFCMEEPGSAECERIRKEIENKEI